MGFGRWILLPSLTPLIDHQTLCEIEDAVTGAKGLVLSSSGCPLEPRVSPYVSDRALASPKQARCLVSGALTVLARRSRCGKVGDGAV